MSRWLTAGAAVALIAVLSAAALLPSAPPAALAQTAPDVRLRETETPSTSPIEGSRPAARLRSLQLSSATLDEDSRALPDGADLTLLAQPTYAALPSAGSNLLRISPAITITARDAAGHAIGLSATARLTFSQRNIDTASVYRLEGEGWRPVQAVSLGQVLAVQPVSPGTYAVFAELPPDWPLQNDLLTLVALNAARLVVDDLVPNP